MGMVEGQVLLSRIDHMHEGLFCEQRLNEIGHRKKLPLFMSIDDNILRHFIS